MLYLLTAALAYGFYKSDLPSADSETAKNIAFVDMGYSGFQVSICALKKESIKVLSSVADPSLGGREIDYRLLQHFIGVFKVSNNAGNTLVCNWINACNGIKNVCTNF